MKQEKSPRVRQRQDRTVLPGLLRISLAGLLTTGITACSYTLVEKPGSRDLVSAHALRANGNDQAALEAIDRGLEAAEDPGVRARLHYDRARLLERRGAEAINQVVQDLEASRRLGYPPATLLLADLHASDRVPGGSRELAARLYEEAFRDDPRAGIALARMIQDGVVSRPGINVAQMVEQSVAGLSARAAAGSTSAARELARLYLEGQLVPPNRALGERYLAAAIQAGDPAAVTDLARVWLQDPNGGQRDRARRMLIHAADRGAIQAMVELGRGYRSGAFGEINLREARRWLQAAVQAGDSGSSVALAEVLLEIPERSSSDIAQAIGLLDAAVEQGHAEAALIRGRLHASGVGGPVDHEKAAGLYRVALAGGVAQGAVELGRAYAEGRGVPADPAQAVALWHRAVDLGSPAAYKDLGEAYASGFGVARDRGRARHFLELAAQGGSISAAMRLGELYEEGIDGSPDYPAAIRWYQVAAEQGSVGAASRLADIYDEGRGVPADLAMAVKWHQLAAERGSLSSMKRLVQVLGDPGSPMADQGAAVRWLHAAAEANAGWALFELAQAYGQGRGVARDPERAAGLIARLAELEPDRAGSIAEAYAQGALGPPDPAKAVFWYRRAADRGNARAMRELAEAYETGTGVAANAQTAESWYRRAAEAGDIVAMRRLAERLVASGTSSGVTQAVALWRRAAGLGDVGSMRALGNALTAGLTGEINLEEAAQWYRAAARAGDGEAQYQLGMMYLQGLGVERDLERAKSLLQSANRNNIRMAGTALEALRALGQ